MAKGIIINHPRGSYRRLSHAEWATLTKLYLRGQSANSLSQRFKIDPGNITSGLRRRGIAIRNSYKRKTLDWGAIVRLYRKGHSTRQLGVLFGVPHTTISRGLTSREISVRKRPSLRVKLSTTEKAYIAGLFDGEGTILIAINKIGRNNGSHWVQISLPNTHLPTIQWLHQRLKGHVRQPVKSHLANRPCWTWCATTRLAISILQSILPFLQIKRERAVLALRLYERINQHKGGAVSRREFQFRERIRLAIKKRNGRGIFVPLPEERKRKYDYPRQFKR